MLITNNTSQTSTVHGEQPKKCSCGNVVTSKEVRLSRYFGGVMWVTHCVYCLPDPSK